MSTDRVEHSRNLFLSAGKLTRLHYSDPNLSMLTYPCNVQFNVLFCCSLCTLYFSCMSCQGRIQKVWLGGERTETPGAEAS